MLSDVVTLSALVQQSPALLLAAVALLFAGWTFRQSRRSDAQLEARLGLSNVRQGKRLGDVETKVGLLDMRRRITEYELIEDGVRLSHWPPDGPSQPHPRRNDRDDRDERDDQADDDATLYTSESPIRVPVPPVPGLPDRLARHRE